MSLYTNQIFPPHKTMLSKPNTCRSRKKSEVRLNKQTNTPTMQNMTSKQARNSSPNQRDDRRYLHILRNIMNILNRLLWKSDSWYSVYCTEIEVPSAHTEHTTDHYSGTMKNNTEIWKASFLRKILQWDRATLLQGAREHSMPTIL